MTTTLRCLVLFGFAATIVNCDMASGTGGRAIQFELQVEPASSANQPLGVFDTSTGWHVKLEQAFVAIGPVYVYQNPPPLARMDVEDRRTLERVDQGLSARGGFDFAASRHPELARFAGSDSEAPPQTPQNQTTPRAGDSLFDTLFVNRLSDFLVPNAYAHAGDEHFFGGEVKGEFLGQIAFDVLHPEGARIREVPGTLGRAQSVSIWLAPPRTSIQGNGNALRGHHAYVVGTAEKEGLVVSFEGGLDIENEGTKRRIDGLPLDVQLDDGVLLTLVLHPQVWFDAAHFDQLSQKNDQGRYVITPESQVRTAWFLGARGFSAFTVETNR